MRGPTSTECRGAGWAASGEQVKLGFVVLEGLAGAAVGWMAVG